MAENYLDNTTLLPRRVGELYSDRNIRIVGQARYVPPDGSATQTIETLGVMIYCTPSGGGANCITKLPDTLPGLGYSLAGASDSSIWVKINRTTTTQTLVRSTADILEAQTSQLTPQENYVQVFYRDAVSALSSPPGPNVVTLGNHLIGLSPAWTRIGITRAGGIYDAVVDANASNPYATHTTIQQAINDVPTGGAIFVREGTYTITTSTAPALDPSAAFAWSGKTISIVGDGYGVNVVNGSTLLRAFSITNTSTGNSAGCGSVIRDIQFIGFPQFVNLTSAGLGWRQFEANVWMQMTPGQTPTQSTVSPSALGGMIGQNLVVEKILNSDLSSKYSETRLDAASVDTVTKTDMTTTVNSATSSVTVTLATGQSSSGYNGNTTVINGGFGLIAAGSAGYFTGTLTGTIVPLTTYYVVNPTMNAFQVAATPGGTPVTATSATGTITFTYTCQAIAQQGGSMTVGAVTTPSRTLDVAGELRVTSGNIYSPNTATFYSDPVIATTVTGTVTLGSTTISAMSSVVGIAIGQTILGTGIPSNTRVVSVGTSSVGTSSVLMSNAASSPATGSIQFLSVSLDSVRAGTLTTGQNVSTTGYLTPGSNYLSIGTITGLAIGNPITGSYVAVGTVTQSSPTITGLSSTAGISIGNSVVGNNIPIGTTIVAVSPAVVMSQNATGTGTGTITFSYIRPTATVASINSPVVTTGTVSSTEITGNVPITIGSPAIVTIGTTVTGTVALSSTTISALSSIVGIAIGQPIVGNSIPANTTVVSIGVNSVVMSNAATGAATGKTITFGMLSQTATGTVALSSTTISAMSSVTGITTGQTIVGNYIPANTYVVSVGANSVVMSNAATGAATGETITFGMLYTTTTATGTVALSSTTISAIPSVTGITTGQTIVGNFIPANTYVVSVGANSVVMSNAATGAATSQSIAFCNELLTGQQVYFTTTGALPTGLTAGVGSGAIKTPTYWVINASATTFNVALTPGGAAINTSGTQSGIHTLHVLPTVIVISSVGTLTGVVVGNYIVGNNIPANTYVVGTTAANVITNNSATGSGRDAVTFGPSITMSTTPYFGLSTTGTVALSSTTISAMSSVTGITAGQTIVGNYIPANTYVVSVGANSVVMSNAAIGAATGEAISFLDSIAANVPLTISPVAPTNGLYVTGTSTQQQVNCTGLAAIGAITGNSITGNTITGISVFGAVYN